MATRDPHRHRRHKLAMNSNRQEFGGVLLERNATNIGDVGKLRCRPKAPANVATSV